LFVAGVERLSPSHSMLTGVVSRLFIQRPSADGDRDAVVAEITRREAFQPWCLGLTVVSDHSQSASHHNAKSSGEN